MTKQRWPELSVPSCSPPGAEEVGLVCRKSRRAHGLSSLLIPSRARIELFWESVGICAEMAGAGPALGAEGDPGFTLDLQGQIRADPPVPVSQLGDSSLAPGDISHADSSSSLRAVLPD